MNMCVYVWVGKGVCVGGGGGGWSGDVCVHTFMYTCSEMGREELKQII